MKRYSFFRYFIFLCTILSMSALLFAGTASCLELRSNAFKNREDIPARYTCKGDDTSPNLNWKGAPDGTQSFVLIVDDPDAPVGTWVHWVVYDIPKNTSSLKKDIPGDLVLDSGAKQGKNSFRKIGYGGPCPPSGPAHRYVFTLYALDTVLGFDAGASKDGVMQAMKGHVLDKAQLIGMFHR